MSQLEHSADLTDIGDGEERYRAVIDALAEGIVLQNQAGTILASNASAARILQMTPDELHGRTSLDPDWRSVTEDGSPFSGTDHPAMVTLRTGKALSNVVMGVRRGRDEPTWISINTRPLQREGATLPYAVVCSFFDITAAKALENELRQSEEKYRTLFEHSKDGILLTRPDGRILSANAAACKMLQRTEAEIVALGRSGVVDLADPRLAVALADRARTGSFASELTFVRADGTRFPVEVTSAVFMGADGEPRSSMLFRDVTERLRLERAKGEFLATVSHELRTPLTSIQGVLGLLAGGVLGALPDSAQEYVRMASSGTERLARMLDHIFDLALFDSGGFVVRRTLVDAQALVASAGERGRAPAAAASVKLVSVIESREQLFVDRARIEQVLSNLVSNAIKFSAPASRVEVAVRAGEAGRVRFAVTDSGPGLATTDVPYLFTRFHQVDSSDSRPKGGAGLGLAVAKTIVEAHGGQIGVDSLLGMGSTFWFELDAYAG